MSPFAAAFRILPLWALPFAWPLLGAFVALAWLHLRAFPRWPLWADPLVWAFGLADVAFNWTIGSALFREVPREWTFSQRVQRWTDGGDVLALRIARVLNRIVPGHILRID